MVFHEYTHLLVRNAVRWVPLWLNEGFAEYYSTYHLSADGRSAEIGRPVARHVQLLRERFIPLTELLEVSPTSDLYNEGERRSIFYAEAWALTHYLMSEAPEGPRQMNEYVALSGTGGDLQAAFLKVFGTTPAEFERRLRQYVTQPLFKSRTFRFKERVETAPTAPAAAISTAQANAWLGDLQRLIGRRADAAARIDAAVAAEPDGAAGQLALGLLRLSGADPKDAWPPLERAAAGAPGDFRTQYLYAVSVLRRADDVPEEAIGRARAALVKATALNPQSSDAFAWLAYAEIQRGDWAEATKAIGQAIVLAPGRLEFRLRQADIMTLRGAINVARPMLQDLAAVTTDPTVADGARRRLEALDRAATGQTPARRSIETPDVFGPSRPAAPALKLDLRPVRNGEQRALGHLTAVECTATQVRFHLSVGQRTVIATATRLADVELTTFTDTKETTLSCGRRVPPDTVYLTWRMEPSRSGPFEIVGVAVAIEFLPSDYVP